MRLTKVKIPEKCVSPFLFHTRNISDVKIEESYLCISRNTKLQGLETKRNISFSLIHVLIALLILGKFEGSRKIWRLKEVLQNHTPSLSHKVQHDTCTLLNSDHAWPGYGFNLSLRYPTHGQKLKLDSDESRMFNFVKIGNEVNHS